MSENTFTRRQMFDGIGAIIAGSIQPRPRLAPLDEIVLVQEFEANARLKLSGEAFSTIAGGDRRAFDRITLRPRLLIPTLDMDLGVDLFGERLFAPILVGPVPAQNRYHSEGELATARGASAAHAAMVVSSRSSAPIDRIAAEAGTPLWYQAAIEPDAGAQIQRAVRAGCKAVCLASDGAPTADWAAIDALRRGLTVPVVATGIMTPAEAEAAIQHEIQGIVVSNGGRPGQAEPIAVLPSIVDAVGGRIPVLIEDHFELGVDIFKALALGAKAVLLGRPPLWGLAAYGAEGVQTVIELLQSELGRAMGMCGNPNLKSLDRSRLKIHA